jgi:crossover junction endodeoxyribonuclease RusA
VNSLESVFVPAVVRFVFEGAPVSKGRPRSFISKGKIVTYTPPQTREAEAAIVKSAIEQGAEPLAGALRVCLRFFEADLRLRDADNLAKLCLDALNGVAFADDKQIRRLLVVLDHDFERPRTEVEIEQMPMTWPPVRPKKARKQR